LDEEHRGASFLRWTGVRSDVNAGIDDGTGTLDLASDISADRDLPPQSGRYKARRQAASGASSSQERKVPRTDHRGWTSWLPCSHGTGYLGGCHVYMNHVSPRSVSPNPVENPGDRLTTAVTNVSDRKRARHWLPVASDNVNVVSGLRLRHSQTCDMAFDACVPVRPDGVQDFHNCTDCFAE
jgi:hypothetical protein